MFLVSDAQGASSRYDQLAQNAGGSSANRRVAVGQGSEGQTTWQTPSTLWFHQTWQWKILYKAWFRYYENQFFLWSIFQPEYSIHFGFDRKITYFCGPFSSQPCLIKPEGSFHLVPIPCNMYFLYTF